MTEVLTLLVEADSTHDTVALWANEVFRHLADDQRRQRQRHLKPCLMALDAVCFEPHSSDAEYLIAQVLYDWREQEYAKGTIKNRLAMLRSFWRWLNSKAPDTIPRHLFDALQMPKGMAAPPVRALSLVQQRRLMEWAYKVKSPSWGEGHLYTFICFGLFNGLRPPELIHLDWSELVQHGGVWFIKIRDLKRRRAKNARARTAIELSPVVASALNDWFKPTESGRIFPQASLTSRHRYHLQKARALIAAPWFNLYALRRSAITNWYNSGFETRCITDLARHSSDLITRKHYIEPSKFIGLDGMPFDVS